MFDKGELYLGLEHLFIVYCETLAFPWGSPVAGEDELLLVRDKGSLLGWIR